MRKNRVIEQNRCYHLISRLAHRAFFLDDEEKDRAVALMRRVEAGVQADMNYSINRTVSISSDPSLPLQTNDCGCKRPRCFCTIEHKAGHYDSNNNLVEINAYRSTKDSVRNTVLHEMQHAYDQCIIGDIADCADRAKREVRAVIRSGRCGRGSKIDWACVKDTAKRSVDKFRECRDTSVEDVESYVKFFLEKLKGVL